jgi:hypothetical protein
MKKNMAHETVPCTRLTFEQLLQDAGFRIVAIEDTNN